jgi:Zn-dependent protease
MPTGNKGSIRLFRFAGINVFLHWSWFLVAVFEIKNRVGYSSIVWNIFEYLALFVIVTLHEFGHALACRQVGGSSNQIVLWPLGGVAYVNPPPRPGATLWSLAAGPLVNVALIPVLLILFFLSRSLGGAATIPNFHEFVKTVSVINVVLLIFNMLPVYPLDGGQILRSLLWFVMGRARSLLVATLVGFVGVAGLILLAVRVRSFWLGIMCVFILLNCWGGLKQSVMLLRMAKLPRHEGFACPWCKASPPMGDLWRCPHCKTMFDTFVTQAVCPHCAAQFPVTQCLECGRTHPISDWNGPAVVTPHPALAEYRP